jgi:hypothetical protein
MDSRFSMKLHSTPTSTPMKNGGGGGGDQERDDYLMTNAMFNAVYYNNHKTPSPSASAGIAANGVMGTGTYSRRNNKFDVPDVAANMQDADYFLSGAQFAVSNPLAEPDHHVLYMGNGWRAGVPGPPATASTAITRDMWLPVNGGGEFSFLLIYFANNLLINLICCLIIIC